MMQLPLFETPPASAQVAAEQWRLARDLAIDLAHAFVALSNAAEPPLMSGRWPVMVGERQLVVRIEDWTEDIAGAHDGPHDGGGGGNQG